MMNSIDQSSAAKNSADTKPNFRGNANDYQVGGAHYRQFKGEQHWDRAWRLHFDQFQYCITKYVERWRDKGGLEDLKKARHHLDKYIELVEQDQEKQRVKSGNEEDREALRGYVGQGTDGGFERPKV